MNEVVDAMLNGGSLVGQQPDFRALKHARFHGLDD